MSILIGHIIYDENEIEGDVLFSDYELSRMTSMEKADVLKDILGIVQNKYNQAVIELADKPRKEKTND